MPPDDYPDLRASDDDRERVVAELGDHLAAGRLDATEFEQRMTAAYGARTLGQLSALMADLPRMSGPPGGRPRWGPSKPAPPATAEPRTPPESAPPESTPRAARSWHPYVGHLAAVPYGRPYASWLLTGTVCLTIWAATSIATGTLLSFWPFWVIVPWGAVLLLGTMRGSPLSCGPAARRRG